MIRVQTEDFDIGAEISRMTAGKTEIGGLASFVGLVRDYAGDEKISSMTLEHYPGMTEKQLSRLEAEAREREDGDRRARTHAAAGVSPTREAFLASTKVRRSVP